MIHPRTIKLLCHFAVLAAIWWIFHLAVGSLRTPGPGPNAASDASAGDAFLYTCAGFFIACIMGCNHHFHKQDRLRREIAEIEGRIGRKEQQVWLAVPPPPDLIERLCRETGRWAIVERLVDRYTIVNTDPRAQRMISVRTCPEVAFIKFTAEFPVRFPLDPEPAGLFARLHLRSGSLRFCSWTMSIWGDCRALVYLHASHPRAVMDAGLFHAICQEMADEIRAFHGELSDRFRYELGGHPASARQAGTGPPARTALESSGDYFTS